jgi:hypothetical protein
VRHVVDEGEESVKIKKLDLRFIVIHAHTLVGRVAIVRVSDNV